MNQKKVYFLTCFVQNIQKPNVVGSRALNDRANYYGPPCRYFYFFWKGIITESKSGRRAILADRVIDCTGDADVAYLAGAEYR